MLTRSRNLPFEKLDQAVKDTFTVHKISPEDWNAYRKSTPWKDSESGAEFIRAEDVIGDTDDLGTFDRNFAIASKFQSMILTETERAIPSTTPFVKSLVTFGNRPGTFGGEIGRNIFLFKSFPITLTHVWLAPLMFGNISGSMKTKLAITMFATTGIMGMIGEQMSDITIRLRPG